MTLVHNFFLSVEVQSPTKSTSEPQRRPTNQTEVKPEREAKVTPGQQMMTK